MESRKTLYVLSWGALLASSIVEVLDKSISYSICIGSLK